MMLLHRLNYSMNNFFPSLDKVEPLDGSHWSTEQKNKFHKILMAYGKDIEYLSNYLGKSIQNCLCYYYGSYKYTADYVKFKKMNKQHRLRCERIDFGLQKGDHCGVCNGDGDLICCDGCDNAYHAQCVSPPLVKIPDEEWYCVTCTKKTSKSKEFLVIGEVTVTTVDVATRKKNKIDISRRNDETTRKPGGLCEAISSSRTFSQKMKTLF